MRPALLAPLLLMACAPAPAPGPMQFSGEASGGVGSVIRLHDLTIRPVEILEDSRCPQGVRCVWAGRVTARVEIGGRGWSRSETMELGRGVALEDARALRLSAVSPARLQGQPPEPDDYRLTFTLGPGD